MRKNLSVLLSIWFPFATLVNAFPSFAHANVATTIEDVKSGVEAVVQQAKKDGKLGTLITYKNVATGATKSKIFWGRISPEEMQQYNPAKISEELARVNQLTRGATEEIPKSHNVKLIQALKANNLPVDEVKGIDAADVDQLLEKINVRDSKSLAALESYLDEQGIVVHRDPIPEGATQEQIDKIQADYIKRVKKTPHGTQALGLKSNLILDSVKRFPVDVSTFAVALGAMATYQLIFNYNENPVGYSQFLEGQGDPFGLASFYMFALGNNAGTGALNATISAIARDRNHGLRHFLPYFGMMFGMGASEISGQIFNFPHLKDCASDLMFRKYASHEDNCQKAWDAWVYEFSVKDTVSEMVPGMLSMWLSTMSATAVEAGTNGAISWAASKIFDVQAIEVSQILVPSKFLVRFAGVTTQTTLFLLFDKLYNPLIVAPWKNEMDGGYLSKLDLNVTNIMKDYTQNGWRNLAPDECEKYTNIQKDAECAKHLTYNLVKLQKKLASWREFNMQDVLSEHNNWTQMVVPSTLMMTESESVYETLLNGLREGPTGNVGQKLFYGFPLYGITPDGVANLDKQRPLYLNLNQDFIPGQVRTIQKVVALFDSANVKNSGLYKALSKDDLSYLNDTLDILRKTTTANTGPAGKRLREINTMLGIQNDFVTDMVGSLTDFHHSSQLKDMLKYLRDQLGNPKPLIYQGEAFVTMFEEDPIIKPQIDALNWTFIAKMMNGGPQTLLDQNSVGMITTKHPVEQILAHAALGSDPEKGDQLFRDSKIMREFLGGMPAVFVAPKITKNFSVGEYQNELLNKVLEAFQPGTIFTKGFTFSGKQMTVWDLIRNKDNIRPDFIANSSNFFNWWDKYVKSQYIKNWTQWEKEYVAIMPKLVKRLWRQDNVQEDKNNLIGTMLHFSQDLTFMDGPRKSNNDLVFNNSPVSNGVMEELQQERKLYMLILGEALKSAGYQMTEDKTHAFKWKSVKVNAGESLLKYLRVSPGLNMADFKNQSAGQTDFANFSFQADLTRDFYALDSLLANIKVRKTQDNLFKADEYIVVSKTSNAEFKAKREQLENDVKAIEAEIANLQPNAIQKKTMEVCLTGIRAVADEIAMFGQIVNAVSYKDVQDGPPQKALCNGAKLSESAADRLATQGSCN